MKSLRFFDKFIFWIFALGMTSFILGCQNGEVTLRQLNIQVDGISFATSYANFITTKMTEFTIIGQCTGEITQVFYRFDDNSEWTAIPSNSVTCSKNSTFKLDFTTDQNKLSSASGYQADANNRNPHLTIEFYGKTKLHKTKVVSINVSQLPEKGNGHLSLSSENALKGGVYTMRGKLSTFGQSTNPLTGSPYKIRNGRLRPTASTSQ
jgi:hypothetical protein